MTLENLVVRYGADSRLADLSLARQTAREDVANAVCMLDEVLRTARRMDFRTFNRAVHLLRAALTKTAS